MHPIQIYIQYNKCVLFGGSVLGTKLNYKYIPIFITALYVVMSTINEFQLNFRQTPILNRNTSVLSCHVRAKANNAIKYTQLNSNVFAFACIYMSYVDDLSEIYYLRFGRSGTIRGCRLMFAFHLAIDSVSVILSRSSHARYQLMLTVVVSVSVIIKTKFV